MKLNKSVPLSLVCLKKETVKPIKACSKERQSSVMILPVCACLSLYLLFHSAQKGQYLEENKKDIYETVGTHISFGSASCAFHTFLSHLHRKPV